MVDFAQSRAASVKLVEALLSMSPVNSFTATVVPGSTPSRVVATVAL